MKKSLNLLALFLVVGLMAMLTACGGGFTDAGDDAGTPPAETMNENAPNADDDGDDDGGDDDGDDGDD